MVFDFTIENFTFTTNCWIHNKHVKYLKSFKNIDENIMFGLHIVKAILRKVNQGNFH